MAFTSYYQIPYVQAKQLYINRNFDLYFDLYITILLQLTQLKLDKRNKPY